MTREASHVSLLGRLALWSTRISGSAGLNENKWNDSLLQSQYMTLNSRRGCRKELMSEAEEALDVVLSLLGK